jgi:hypothetical protein
MERKTLTFQPAPKVKPVPMKWEVNSEFINFWSNLHRFDGMLYVLPQSFKSSYDLCYFLTMEYLEIVKYSTTNSPALWFLFGFVLSLIFGVFWIIHAEQREKFVVLQPFKPTQYILQLSIRIWEAGQEIKLELNFFPEHSMSASAFAIAFTIPSKSYRENTTTRNPSPLWILFPQLFGNCCRSGWILRSLPSIIRWLEK